MVSGNISTFLQNQDVALNCALASWYDPKKKERLVVYQEMEEGHLKEYNIVKKQGIFLFFLLTTQLTFIALLY